MPATPTYPSVSSLITILPYQPVNINCTMFQSNLEVNLWQESTSGSLIRRIPDGVTLIRQDSVFTITLGRQSDEGTYYCQAAGSQKIPAAILTFPGNILKHLFRKLEISQPMHGRVLFELFRHE